MGWYRGKFNSYILCPPQIESVCSSRHLRMRHALVTETHTYQGKLLPQQEIKLRGGASHPLQRSKALLGSTVHCVVQQEQTPASADI